LAYNAKLSLRWRKGIPGIVLSRPPTAGGEVAKCVGLLATMFLDGLSGTMGRHGGRGHLGYDSSV
jgi:hypothetical protein